MSGKQLLLFTGAGTSIPSGLPCTRQITGSLLTGSWRGVRDGLADDWIFRPHDKTPNHRSDPTDAVQSFLKLLKSYADGYYALRTGRESNYEDLYYLARQICEDEINVLENPAIGEFIDELRSRMPAIQRFAGQEIELKNLAGHCCSLIHWVVFHELSRKVDEIRGLDLVGELTRDPTVGKFDICTLNHDLLFEVFLHSIDMPNDGFRLEKASANVRFFDYDNFDTSQKVRLFKLHGSINWYRFRPKENGNAAHRFGISVSSDPQHCGDDRLQLATRAPEFLTGTYNKLAAYEAHIYADLHHWFHRLLREHNTILISGYGWGDSGINQRMFEWFFRSPKNRMVLMHKEDELPQLLNSFRDTLRPCLKELIDQKLVLKTGKWMEHTRAKEIFELLG